MSGFLGFLKSAKVKEVSVPVKGPGGVKKQRNPAPALLAIRVWKDGSVYPSLALVDKFNLEYVPGKVTIEEVPAKAAVLNEDGSIKTPAKEATTRRITTVEPPAGNGFDVIDSRAWGQWESDNHMLFIGAVDKNEPKVDLFASTVYDDEGKPKSTVMDQGAKTFGTEVLIPAIKELYNLDFNEEREYIDMLVASELEGVNINEAFSHKITFVPKRISRGKDAGKSDYCRRENMTIYGFVPVEVAGLIAATTTEGEVPMEHTDETSNVSTEEGTTLPVTE